MRSNGAFVFVCVLLLLLRIKIRNCLQLAFNGIVFISIFFCWCYPLFSCCMIFFFLAFYSAYYIFIIAWPTLSSSLFVVVVVVVVVRLFYGEFYFSLIIVYFTVIYVRTSQSNEGKINKDSNFCECVMKCRFAIELSATVVFGDSFLFEEYCYSNRQHKSAN